VLIDPFMSNSFISWNPRPSNLEHNSLEMIYNEKILNFLAQVQDSAFMVCEVQILSKDPSIN